MDETKDIIVTLPNRVLEFDFEELDLTAESEESEVLEAIRNPVLEAEGVDIVEDDIYTVKYLTNGQLSVFPKSTMG